MIVGALRRFALMYGGVGAFTVVLSLAFGALTGASLSRSIAIGLYLVGALILLFAFFVGNRGPFRHERHDTAILPHGIRRATPDERRDAVSVSALLVALGLGLILLGVVSDSSHRLF